MFFNRTEVFFMIKRIIIITGVSGSGKSQFVNRYFDKNEQTTYITTRQKRKNDDCICISEKEFNQIKHRLIYLTFKGYKYAIDIKSLIKKVIHEKQIIFILSPIIANKIPLLPFIYFIVINHSKDTIKNQLLMRDGTYERIERYSEEHHALQSLITKIQKSHYSNEKIFKMFN